MSAPAKSFEAADSSPAAVAAAEEAGKRAEADKMAAGRTSLAGRPATLDDRQLLNVYRVLGQLQSYVWLNHQVRRPCLRGVPALGHPAWRECR
jgi:hypothetical protein